MSKQIKNNKFAAEKIDLKRAINNKIRKKICQKIQEKFHKLSAQ